MARPKGSAVFFTWVKCAAVNGVRSKIWEKKLRRSCVFGQIKLI